MEALLNSSVAFPSKKKQVSYHIYIMLNYGHDVYFLSYLYS